MKTIVIDGILVNAINIDDEKEIKEYVNHAMKKYGTALKEVVLRPDPEDVDYIVMTCKVDEPFERIRRITGYLVGDVSSFNDAKRAEEHDRVKHST